MLQEECVWVFLAAAEGMAAAAKRYDFVFCLGGPTQTALFSLRVPSPQFADEALGWIGGLQCRTEERGGLQCRTGEVVVVKLDGIMRGLAFKVGLSRSVNMIL